MPGYDQSLACSGVEFKVNGFVPRFSLAGNAYNTNALTAYSAGQFIGGLGVWSSLVPVGRPGKTFVLESFSLMTTDGTIPTGLDIIWMNGTQFFTTFTDQMIPTIHASDIANNVFTARIRVLASDFLLVGTGANKFALATLNPYLPISTPDGILRCIILAAGAWTPTSTISLQWVNFQTRP